MQWLRRQVRAALSNSVDVARPFMRPVAMMGIFAFPLFWVPWAFWFPQPYESLPLRLLGSALCVPVVLQEHWPARLQRYFALYWQLTVGVCLPFLFPYFALQNALSEEWVLSTIGAIFLFSFLLDWRCAALWYVAGTLGAWLAASVYGGAPVGFGAYLKYLVIFSFPLAFGSLISGRMQHYRRMHSAFEQRLRKITNENARRTHELNQLLSRFLSNTIVSQLWRHQRTQGLDEAIGRITRQEVRFCGIMQADVRNFTKLFGREPEMQVASLIRRCFSEITEIGQDLAVIKPVGDCLFVYCDGNGDPARAVADVTALATFLVSSVERSNLLLAARGSPPLNFGIAVHAGPVVYGNLASDNLIDPTIIGVHVNETARLEALTKVPAVAERIGPNAVLISEELLSHNPPLLRPRLLETLELEPLGIEVRDFPEVRRVYALTRERAMALQHEASDYIEGRRAGQRPPHGQLEVSSYMDVPYYFEMQGMGADTSWLILIDVSAMPLARVHEYASLAISDLDYEINTTNGQWLVVSTEAMAGEFDENDVQARVLQIIEGLEHASHQPRA